MPALEATVDLALSDAEPAVRQALSNHGFGVLTEIDVAKTLETKIGVVRPPMKILGACNPTFAHRAMEVDIDVALWMPCNVVLEQRGDSTRITIADPHDIMADESMCDVADDATRELEAALAEVAPA